ncbi:hypothetical protein BOW35_05060 [Solemya velum gill symbiont]|uniref:general secretion pathway protein GspB n=1 Tax=Solemya velum gill symbiont TaxID=2340 RepID=UPI0009960D29|nr:general secretion pathway protein GspB [Solemya velum gill symbiont]OOZ15338.1 hypothetical protein BOW27_04835 [Solemya velum gill symbiont]OOZ19259.1 hypothetical protein BOW29_08135 [Solemya velum gill symbiont]OOZ24842.1 hypothetical protein BOW31_04355 [Solemya velum gill symbiont]OOZ29677.1 hypothetical protein BOW33_04215 [Solemya velum gill symbiont]OOZ31947.1 hypothetical protein BOW34_05835 [Solemya velum gill symbiont]
MSLILEALKKSERERLGNAASVPLVTRPRHALESRNVRRRRQSRLVVVMIALLLVAALAAWLLTQRQGNMSPLDQAREGDRDQLPQASVVEPPSVSSPQALPPPQVEMRPQVEQQQLPVEIPSQAEPAEVVVDKLPQQVQITEPVSDQVIEPVIEPLTEPVVEEIETPEPPVQLEPVPQEPEVVSEKSDLRTFRQLPSSLRNSLKPMHLDVHVYDRRESRRFVYISGRLYSEGARLKNGAEVIEIVPTGVVMRINGEQFLLTVND